MNEKEDLWGELPHVNKIKTPLIVLKEQAEIISEKTNNLIEGRVNVISPHPNRMKFLLGIKAPALGGYSANIVTVEHDIKMYPLEIRNNLAGITYNVDNEKEYLGTLAEILQSDEVKKIISAILVQIESSKVD